MSERLWYLGGRGVGLLFRAWALTLRFEQRWSPRITFPYVAAVWHGRIVGAVMANIGCRTVTMASRSSDGALAAGIVDGTGLRATRGSTAKGGREALDEMEQAVRQGAPFATLTVDGPHGPWRRVKVGALTLARRLAVPIVPITATCRRPLVLRSWDRMVIPKPFTRVLVEWGEPFSPDELGGDTRPLQEAIASRLDAMTAALDREMLGRELWPARSPAATPSEVEAGVGAADV